MKFHHNRVPRPSGSGPARPISSPAPAQRLKTTARPKAAQSPQPVPTAAQQAYDRRRAAFRAEVQRLRATEEERERRQLEARATWSHVLARMTPAAEAR